ncbi:MAG: UDP-N-acetylmuramoyl-L-alanyl-D-glutamate--2,6-diaminopimelate ligase [Alphaproteobacteria bacterium]
MVAMADIDSDRALSDLQGITGLTADSREVGPGFLFAALPGARADGRAFIGQAVRNGAVVVLAPTGSTLPDGMTGVRLITDDRPRRRFAAIAAAFYCRQPATIAAVTGTNGKTSTANFTRQIWESLGHRAASLGTLGITAPGMDDYGALTTPDPVALHASLADLAAAGITHLAMEASSHGLDQYRLDGVRVGAAGFTNLSRDHLDYHGTMEAYLGAKSRLFDEVLQPGGTAVLNADAPETVALAARVTGAGHTVMTYGARGRAIRLDDATPLVQGLRLKLQVMDRPLSLVLPLVGGFQAQNALCALGLVLAGGADPVDATGALSVLRGVRGRLELAARHPNGAPIYVDFAHTPDALATVLSALRPHAAARLVAVFGCGGDRDQGKRPVMGRTVRQLADRAIVTDDNPRTEDPAAIRAAVLAACPDAAEIGDRGEAIRTAIAGLAPDDVLVIAGKGHETGQIVGEDVHPFDDAECARAAAIELGGTAPAGGRQ